jgi:glycerol uptake facilitator protein
MPEFCLSYEPKEFGVIDPSVFGEFLGTAMLVLLGDGIVAGVLLAKSKAKDAGWVAVTVAWGLAVFAGIILAAAVGDKDGHLNPAFTLASVMMTGHSERLFTYIPAQMLGGLVGATLVWLFYRPHFEETADQTTKLGVFCTIPAIRNYASNFFCEVVGTFVLVLMATAFGSRRLILGASAPTLGPTLVGALVWAIGLSLGGTTGYAINPARDLGPRLAHYILPIRGKGKSDWSYAWIPGLGPFAGAALAALFIKWIGM